MSIADQFRAKGIECVQRATRLADPELKRLYYDLALQWIALAAEVEARAAKTASPPVP
jgi:hypothetical protein